MKVSYVTPFYSGECEGRYGRFHDWIHTLRDLEHTEFTFDVHPVISGNPDDTVASPPLDLFGDGDELWATRVNNLETLANAHRIHNCLKESAPDVVHLIAPDPLLLPPILSATPDVPLIIGPNIGGWYPNRNQDVWSTSAVDKFKQKYKFWIRRQILSNLKSRVVLSFSEYHSQMIKQLGVSEESITVLHPGVDHRFCPSPSKDSLNSVPELLYVGDLSSHKGYDRFLESLGKLDVDFEATIAGAGDPNRGLIRQIGIEDQVSIEGFVHRENLPEYYRSADIFVIPSIDEMGPNTQVEALASGTPVVTTDSPGLNEYPPRDAAVFFWPREADSLAEALSDALENLDQLTESAISHSAEFRAEQTVSHLADIYRKHV